MRQSTQHSYVQVAKDTEILKEDVSKVVDAVLASITKALVSGNKVSEPFSTIANLQSLYSAIYA